MGEKYRLMSDSLFCGETDFALDEAKLLRLKILKIAENIDLISKRICAIDVDQPISGLQLQLQKRIRAASVNFVKEGLVGLPDVPTEDEFEQLKVKRREHAQLKVEQEKESARIARLRYARKMNASPAQRQNNKGLLSFTST